MNTNIIDRLIAHRGGKFFGLENTKEAFEAAIKLGYYGIECDIQPTKDGKLVVYHDLNLKRLSNIDKNVVDFDWEYLKTIELKKVETDQNTYQGHLMLFEDFLTLIKDSSCVAFIEMKETFHLGYVYQMLEMIRTSGIDQNQVVIIANMCSFHLLTEIRKLDQNIKLQFVAKTNYENYLEDCIKYQIDLDISLSIYFENREAFIFNVNKFHTHGLEVNCWVTDDMRLLKELAEIGVDYITTDSLKLYRSE